MNALTVEASPWQRLTMTALPLIVLGAFAGSLWFGADASWAKPAAVLLGAGGVALSALCRRGIKRMRVSLDEEGIAIDDGQGRERHAARWDAVASAGIERRFGVAVGPSDFLILRDSTGHERLQLSTQLCSREDTRRVLDFAAAQLAERGIAFEPRTAAA